MGNLFLDLSLAIVYLTSVRGFAFYFYLIILFETTGFVFIFVSVVSSTFNKLPFMFTVGVTRKILDPNKSYYKILTTAPPVII